MDNPRGKTRLGKFSRCLTVAAGIVLGQAILYGPCLIGSKVLLPVDLLAEPDIYLPQNPDTARIIPHDITLSDLIYQFEPARRFASSEIHQGRFPSWGPYQYGGAPFVWPKFSLFLLLECVSPSPIILAWVQLMAALVAGVGMYFFCRQALGVGFWPATVCAWCYPLTAFFVLWQGFPTGLGVYWLPWICWSVDKTIRGSSPWAVIALSLATFLTLTSGHVDVGVQVLVGSGIFALWSWWDTHRGEWFGRKSMRAARSLVFGWGLGLLLAAPHILPLLEYTQTSARMLHRIEGAEDRPPFGLAALPQVILPDIYGTFAQGSYYIIPPDKRGNLIESAAAAYAGILATLVVAPLAWCGRPRALNRCWLFLALFGSGWCLNLPGLVQLLRLPGLNLMSYNRLVFLTAFAILALTAIGLENLRNGAVSRRWWFWIPALLMMALCLWCNYRTWVLPEPLATQLDRTILGGHSIIEIRDIHDVRQVQAWFIRHYAVTAALCCLGFLAWLWLWFQKEAPSRLFPLLALFMLADLLWFDYGRSAQCDPALYFPKIPALANIAQSVPGRVIGANCLPASLAMMQGLTDIRGYDSIDPERMVTLLKTAAKSGPNFSYAAIQEMTPDIQLSEAGVRLPPVLDMLNVRYVIFRGRPPPRLKPALQSDDYWVLINAHALPRAYVPRTVKTAANDGEELAALASPKFSPADAAYIESPVELPADCRGTAQITNEIPTRVTLSVQMETPGLVVLADHWDQGWRAYWNGKRLPVLRTNYAVRGVVVPAGKGTLEFVYHPVSLYLGLGLAGLAAVVLLGWGAVLIAGRKGTQLVVPAEPAEFAV